ncbi:MAG: hypothetical protein ACUZ8E_16550 [Candidatus Anammoxibacter sp.]
MSTKQLQIIIICLVVALFVSIGCFVFLRGNRYSLQAVPGTNDIFKIDKRTGKTWLMLSGGIERLVKPEPKTEEVELKREEPEKPRYVFDYTTCEKTKSVVKHGYEYLERKEYVDAMIAFQDAIEIEPECIVAHQGLSKIFKFIGMDDKAKEEEKIVADTLQKP